MPMTAPGTPVAAGAFAISSEPREDQPRPVPHDSAGGAEGHPQGPICARSGNGIRPRRAANIWRSAS